MKKIIEAVIKMNIDITYFRKRSNFKNDQRFENLTNDPPKTLLACDSLKGTDALPFNRK